MHFTVEAQRIVATHLKAGNLAIDATAGNGHDTLFLADAVGPSGMVYAIDIQQHAIDRLRQNLQQRHLSNRVELFTADHAHIKQLVATKLPKPIDCAMFNLGYLPHSDKSITTKRESTLQAIDSAFQLLRPGGMMTILAYLGHDGGREEAEGVSDWIDMHAMEFEATRSQDDNNPHSPILWVIRRNMAKHSPGKITGLKGGE